MDQDQLAKIKEAKGFIAALDQSGGSTPKALKAYGINEDGYSSEEEMFDLVHEMRVRIMTSSAFTGDKILGAILFKETMERQVEGRDTADYLWEEKSVVPFLKIDAGLEDEKDGVQLMKPIPDLDDLLNRAKDKNIFGTKMRSVINDYDEKGIDQIVSQQFEVAGRVISHGLVPIIEPEVNIHSERKAEIEKYLVQELTNHLDGLEEGKVVMLKLTLPEVADLYQDLVNHTRVLLVVALSGGYSREEANTKLAQNHGVVASFSRALASDLSVDQTEEEFDRALDEAITSIYEASIK